MGGNKANIEVAVDSSNVNSLTQSGHTVMLSFSGVFENVPIDPLPHVQIQGRHLF